MESKIQEKVTDENQEFDIVEYQPEFEMAQIVEDRRAKVVYSSQSSRDEFKQQYIKNAYISDQLRKVILHPVKHY